MDVGDPDVAIAPVAAAIGEPARVRMLYGLADGRARTSTELAIMAGVTPPTASAHLHRLLGLRLVTVVAQGKHRYYRLDRPEVAAALEALSVVAGGGLPADPPMTTPHRLRDARTCYDHIAGTLGVALYDRFSALGWLAAPRSNADVDVTSSGRSGFAALGIDLAATRALRRRFAFACLDWSERRPHLGGALGAAVLHVARKRRWVSLDLDSRALHVTTHGRRDMRARLGMDVGRGTRDREPPD